MFTRVAFEKTLLKYPQMWLGRGQVIRSGFWFVDIPRCSSTSIRAELGMEFGRAFGRTREQEAAGKVKPYFIDHISAQSMRRFLPQGAWEKLFTFSMVRNPWDRVLSLYYQRHRKGDIPQELSFKGFLGQLERPRYMLNEVFHTSPNYFMPMVDFLCDREDNLIVDFVGRFERRDEDLAKIREKIGCKELGQARMAVSGRKKTYVDEYDDESAELVAKFYADDIERFGYRFGE